MSENDDGIYIDCQPVDINGDDIPEIKTPNKIIFKPLEHVFGMNKIFKREVTNTNDIKYNYIITCIIIIIIVCIPKFVPSSSMTSDIASYKNIKESAYSTVQSMNNPIYISFSFILILGLYILDDINTEYWFFGSVIISFITIVIVIFKIYSESLLKPHVWLSYFGYFFIALSTLMSLFLFFLQNNVAWLKKVKGEGIFFFLTAANIIILLLKKNALNNFVNYSKFNSLKLFIFTLFSFPIFIVSVQTFKVKQSRINKMEDELCDISGNVNDKQSGEGFTGDRVYNEGFISQKCKTNNKKVKVGLRLKMGSLASIIQTMLFLYITIKIQLHGVDD